MRRASLALIGILLLTAAISWAGVAGRPRQICGKVQAVENESKQMTFAGCGDQEPLILAWDEETKFIKNGEFDSSSSLEAGTHAQISHRSPFFGEAFLLKVRWPIDCPVEK